jgi:hypothetical protein
VHDAIPVPLEGGAKLVVLFRLAAALALVGLGRRRCEELVFQLLPLGARAPEKLSQSGCS